MRDHFIILKRFCTIFMVALIAMYYFAGNEVSYLFMATWFLGVAMGFMYTELYIARNE
jgi:hypothetical protein